jgi:hypothetical protein
VGTEALTGHKDYSGTPLPKKLGITAGSRLALVGAPEGFEETLGELPPGVTVLTRAAGVLDVAVVFATRETALARRVPPLVPPLVRALAPDGGLWIAWPKKASKVATDLTFDAVQRLGLAAGLVDNKSASIDDIFQGLRFVYRLKDRPGQAQPRRG